MWFYFQNAIVYILFYFFFVTVGEDLSILKLFLSSILAFFFFIVFSLRSDRENRLFPFNE